MPSILKIGLPTTIFLNELARYVVMELQNLKVDVTIESFELSTQGDDAIADLLIALKNGVVHAIAIPLEICPYFSESDSICITAISDRIYTGEGIIFEVNDKTPQSLHEIGAGNHIGVFSERQSKQLQLLFPDTLFTTITTPRVTRLADYFIDGIDGLASTMLFYNMMVHDKQKLIFIPFHPSELTPSAGHGVIAYICNKDDLDTRKVLQKIHHPEWVPIVNCERQVVKEIEIQNSGRIGVFCTKKMNNIYQIYGFSSAPCTRTREYQSVLNGLVEKVKNSLFKQQ